MGRRHLPGGGAIPRREQSGHIGGSETAPPDIDEGADILMVKPALAYLDVIARLADHTGMPIAAYLVSGEYSMIKLMAREGMADEAALVREHMHAVRRAGAQILITYHARVALAEGWL